MELDKIETIVKTVTINLTNDDVVLFRVILTNALIQLNAGFRKGELSKFGLDARKLAIILEDKLCE